MFKTIAEVTARMALSPRCRRSHGAVGALNGALAALSALSRRSGQNEVAVRARPRLGVSWESVGNKIECGWQLVYEGTCLTGIFIVFTPGNTMDSCVAVCAFFLIVQHSPAGQCTTWPCDFETSALCGYTQDTTDHLDWTRHSGSSLTSSTGPSVDHTLGTSSGHYMYLETSAGSPGEAARLVSAPLPASSTPYCLRFYYHMFGDSIETLNVYIRTQGILGNSVWTISGNQGNVWMFGHAQLVGSNSFNVVFEAVRGDSFRGDIAIDDVTVSDECVPVPIATTVLPPTTSYPLASPSCTFELLSMCGYRQDIHDSAEWTWYQGQTGTSDTGPGLNHTIGTALGHYVYLEASNIDPGVTARLLSPTLPAIPLSSSHTSYCLSFWYHMYGLHIGTLTVKQKGSGAYEVPVWSLSGAQTSVLRKGQLPLNGTMESTVVFEAVRGSSYRGDIAIDCVDVIQYRGQCECIPASAMVPSTSTVITQLPSTSGTSTSIVTITEKSITMTTETSSTIVTVATGPSSETEKIIIIISGVFAASATGRYPMCRVMRLFNVFEAPPRARDPRFTSLPEYDFVESFVRLQQSGRPWLVSHPSTVRTARCLTSEIEGSGVSNAPRGRSMHASITASAPPTPIITTQSFSKYLSTSGTLSNVTTPRQSSATIIIVVVVVLSIVCGVVAGAVTTVYYNKKKRNRSVHTEVKYFTEENTSASAGDSCPSVVNERVEFENPTFAPIYKELPSLAAESDYLPPISDPNVHGPNLNHMTNNKKDYERIRDDQYQNLNPRPSTHFESLRPGYCERVTVLEHAQNPDGYRSLRYNPF
ncbi:MALRD1 [Branchiostoma lanceolatum]|uniref:MALRD1 protein n=1 Tax=Branchiostoma lanceolatum TaxID=7740 RepID=A0A8J9VN76_BRALA|nr:MALRD1 [Branchiostoma lanceolatum]